MIAKKRNKIRTVPLILVDFSWFFLHVISQHESFLWYVRPKCVISRAITHGIKKKTHTVEPLKGGNRYLPNMELVGPFMFSRRNTCTLYQKYELVSILKSNEHVDLSNEVCWWVYIVEESTTEVSVSFRMNPILLIGVVAIGLASKYWCQITMNSETSYSVYLIALEYPNCL